jgi:hypothetical protein
MEPHDCFGFIAGRSCEVFWPEPQAGEELKHSSSLSLAE